MSAKDPIPFHRPALGPYEEAAVLRVLRSGWLTTGREAEALEREFCEFVGAPAAVAVSSCTAALHLACVLAGWTSREQRVLVPTMTFAATAAAVIQAGATPVLCDVDPETLNLSLDEIPLHRSASGVVAVHYGGNPSGFCELAQAAASANVPVVVDAAHALPASFEGQRMVGAPFSMSTVVGTCFSFYATKTVTMGEGGMLAISRDLESRARRATLHGIDADAYRRSRGGLYHYEVVDEGWKYNLPDLLAAVGRAQLARAWALQDRRAQIAWLYRQHLGHGVVRHPAVDGRVNPAWHLYPVRLHVGRFKEGWTRDRVAEELGRRGVGVSLHYRPLHLHPYFMQFVRSGEEFPAADAAYARLLSLPIWPGMSDSQVGRVADELLSVLKEAER